MLHGKVVEWKMTEELRLAYIEKHPIVPTEKPKGASFVNADFEESKMRGKRDKANFHQNNN